MTQRITGILGLDLIFIPFGAGFHQSTLWRMLGYCSTQSDSITSASL